MLPIETRPYCIKCQRLMIRKAGDRFKCTACNRSVSKHRTMRYGYNDAPYCIECRQRMNRRGRRQGIEQFGCRKCGTWVMHRSKKNNSEAKKCNNCGETKPLTEFKRDPRMKSGYGSPCKVCITASSWTESRKESARRWREKYANERSQKAKAKSAALRAEVLMAYGNICVCCGEFRKEFLAVDHIAGDGNKHRRETKGKFYVWLKKNNFPKDNFRLLCHNCNMARGIYGYCPHEKETQ